MRKMMAIPLLLAGCTSAFDIDMAGFSPLPDVEALDYSKVEPAASHTYWELRYAFEGSAPTVLGAGGTLRRDQLDPAQRAELDAARPPTGFALSCLPGHCYKYVAAVNGAVSIYNTAEALAAFLGNIDGMEEAALTAHARGLYWNDSPDTGYRAVDAGWEIVALELVRACAPVQTDRVLLLVRRNGAVQELGREVYSKAENACI